MGHESATTHRSRVNDPAAHITTLHGPCLLVEGSDTNRARTADLRAPAMEVSVTLCDQLRAGRAWHTGRSVCLRSHYLAPLWCAGWSSSSGAQSQSRYGKPRSMPGPSGTGRPLPKLSCGSHSTCSGAAGRRFAMSAVTACHPCHGYRRRAHNRADLRLGFRQGRGVRGLAEGHHGARWGAPGPHLP